MKGFLFVNDFYMPPGFREKFLQYTDGIDDELRRISCMEKIE